MDLVAPLEAFPIPDPAAWRKRVGAEAARALGLADEGQEAGVPVRANGAWRIAAEYDLEGVDLVLEGPPELDLAPYHRAGANPKLELAYLVARLYPRAEEASRLRVGFEVGREIFEEVAKLRAARLLWAKTLMAAGAEVVAMPELRATTAWRTLTTREPMNNVLRATTQAYAAVLGGADVIVVRPHEESDEARRLAVHLQLILRHEARLDRSVDACRGSYWVERRTRELAREAWDHARGILEAGGFDEQRAAAECESAWQQRAERLREGSEGVLGVNLHPLDGALPGNLGRAPQGSLALHRDEEACV